VEKPKDKKWKVIPIYPGGHGIHEVIDQLSRQAHEHEHETLQVLQRHALNGKHDEFFKLLDAAGISPDKQKEFIEICGMERIKND
jgi:hypothetical protein